MGGRRVAPGARPGSTLARGGLPAPQLVGQKSGCRFWETIGTHPGTREPQTGLARAEDGQTATRFPAGLRAAGRGEEVK